MRRSYRIRFVAGVGHEDYAEWVSMVTEGYACMRQVGPVTGGTQRMNEKKTLDERHDALVRDAILWRSRGAEMLAACDQMRREYAAFEKLWPRKSTEANTSGTQTKGNYIHESRAT
jgi:hypothetical protein